MSVKSFNIVYEKSMTDWYIIWKKNTFKYYGSHIWNLLPN